MKKPQLIEVALILVVEFLLIALAIPVLASNPRPSDRVSSVVLILLMPIGYLIVRITKRRDD